MTAHVPPHSPWPGEQPPQQWGPPPTPSRKRRKWPFVLGAIVLLVVLIGVANAGNEPPRVASSPPSSPGGWTGSGSATVRATVAPAVPSGPLSSFGSGTYEVGTGDGQVAPGKYKTAGPDGGDYGSCYWARLKDTTGEMGSIIANGNAEGPTVVSIGPRDGAFETRCEWTKVS